MSNFTKASARPKTCNDSRIQHCLRKGYRTVNTPRFSSCRPRPPPAPRCPPPPLVTCPSPILPLPTLNSRFRSFVAKNRCYNTSISHSDLTLFEAAKETIPIQ
ncbi:hypothetical protein J6590_071332 [Homalodisca vitripennis]|nr:hypothetical protein J6590_071332 [Homalodisca vitripennis]